MKRKYLWSVMLAGVCVVIIFGSHACDDMKPLGESFEGKNIEHSPPVVNNSSVDASDLAKATDRPVTAEDVFLIERSNENFTEEKVTKSHPDFAYYTSPTQTGVIKNAKGEVLFRATAENPFVLLKSRTGISHIVVVSYDRNAFLIDLESKEQIVLPKQPPEKGAKGFDTWEWIDAETLLGISYVQAFASDGEPIACCQGHGISETRLYTYSVSSNALHRVKLPGSLAKTALDIGRITDDGAIEIFSKDTHTGKGASVGWFEIKTTR